MPQAKVGGANRRDERRTGVTFAKATVRKAVPAKATAPKVAFAKATAAEELPHDGRMCDVDGANHAGQAAVLVGAPAGEEMRREERLDPAVEGRRLAFRRSRAAGAMERLTDPGRERVAPRLPRPDIVGGRGNHRQRIARAA